MKLRRSITTGLIIIVLVSIVAFRLISNKLSFDNQLKMVSELNTTIPVMTDTVKYHQIDNGFSVDGTFLPFREISVISETSGKITMVRSETGDRVRKGDILATVDNEMFESQLAAARFNLEKAEKDLRRFEELSKGDAATVQQYESVKQLFINAQLSCTSARIQNDNSFIKAPFSGNITRRYIETGGYLAPGAPAFYIVETDRLKLIARLTATEVAEVSKGEPVKITVESFPGISYEGIVGNIVIKADLSGRYDTEIDVNNQTGNKIKPGMYGTVLFANDAGDHELVIPRSAIAGSILDPEVFLVKGDSVTRQSITASSLDNKNVIVKNGLKEGDIIVTSGQINLISGSKIRIRN